jgi:biotin carboxyl carrier protein
MTVAPTRLPAPGYEVLARANPAVDPATALSGSVAEELGVLVAPSTGRFRPEDGSVDRWHGPGALLGHITGGKGRADEVRMPVGATVADFLVRPGQLVHRGQGLAWLRRPPRGLA